MNRPIRSGKRRLGCMVCWSVVKLFFHKFFITSYEICQCFTRLLDIRNTDNNQQSSFSDDKDVCIACGCDRGSVTRCPTSCKIANSGRVWMRRPHVLMRIIRNVPRRAPLQNTTAAVWYFRSLCSILIRTVAIFIKYVKFTRWFYTFVVSFEYKSKFCSYRWNGLQLLVSKSHSESKKWHV